jgi:hypothetical protein
LDLQGREELAALLEQVLLKDNTAACEAAARLIEGGAFDRRIQDQALGWLRKLAHRGYEGEFRRLADRLRAAALASPGRLDRLLKGIGDTETLFDARIAGRRRHAEPRLRGQD